MSIPLQIDIYRFVQQRIIFVGGTNMLIVKISVHIFNISLNPVETYMFIA